MSSDRTPKDIAATIRQNLKEKFPECKFSVTVKDYHSITVALMACPFQVFRDENDVHGRAHKGYVQLNHYYLKKDSIKSRHYETGETLIRCNGGVLLTEKAWNTLSDVVEIGLAEHWDKSDTMTDYFHCAYYFSLHIGKWDKALVDVKDPESERTVVASDEADPVEVAEVATATQPKPNAYEKKLEARRERYEQRAEQARATANNLHGKAHDMASVIPFGQPILVGHHSERRDRNYRGRIESTFRKSFEEQEKATYYEDKAAAVGTGGISSDDPEAIDKLREKLAGMEAHQARMKEVNAALRKLKDEASRRAWIVANCTGPEQKALSDNLRFRSEWGFAGYELTNNNANIRRVKERIAQLEAEAVRPEFTLDTGIAGVTVYEEDNRICIKFPGKPAEAVREALRRHAFIWAPSRTAWVRQANANGRYAAKAAIEAIRPLMS